jgi:hypothetical protein
MKLDSPKAEALVVALTGKAIGQEIPLDLPSLLPALNYPCTATLAAVDKGYFEITLRWMNIFIATVVAEVQGTNLTLEVL